MRDLCDFKISYIRREGAWIEVKVRYYEGENKVWLEDGPGAESRYGRQIILQEERFNFPHDTTDEDILRTLGDDLVTNTPKPPIPEIVSVRAKGRRMGRQ